MIHTESQTLRIRTTHRDIDVKSRDHTKETISYNVEPEQLFSQDLLWYPWQAVCSGRLNKLKPMIHGSTSFNFCWSTNVEHCCDLLKRCCNLLNTHSTFVEQQQHFGAKLKWRTRKCCCRFALRALSPLSWSGDKKDAKTAKFGRVDG